MTRDVRDLLHAAAGLYRDDPRASALLHDCLNRLEQPLRVAFAGAPSSGKTTLAAALGEWPTRALRDLVLLDDPGPADEFPDATVRLVRHLEPDELAAAHQPGGSAFARQSAVNSVLVLSAPTRSARAGSTRC